MINLQEREKKVPVKFYKDSYGTIYYESSFTNGTAPSLNDAFSEFNDKNLDLKLIEIKNIAEMYIEIQKQSDGFNGAELFDYTLDGLNQLINKYNTY